jgi:predicted ArsR family transcriptional regulator
MAPPQLVRPPLGEGSAVDTTTFDQELGALASSLGDATRRGIYISVREAAEPATASQIAELFELHTNVARHHLDKLVADGYLRVTHRRRPGKRGPGAGRPAKHYEPTRKEVSVQFPERRYDLLAELLLRVVERLDPEGAKHVAEEIGAEFGRELAAEVGIPEDAGFNSAVQSVARVMLGVGFETSTEVDDHALVTRHCPFGETATQHPDIVCRLDQGIVRGLLAASNQEARPIVIPHLSLSEACYTDL